MPANLTPQYLAAERRFKEASTPAEKVAALEEMLAVIPKHKGTEKLQADLKRRLAKLNQESQKKHGASKASAIYSVPKEGAGQVLLAGAPNSGKSSLLKSLTHANPEIGDYPFTTRLPQPGMMPFENVQVQIVDMPPFSQEVWEAWMGNLVRQSDMLLLVADSGNPDVLEEIQQVLGIIEGLHVLPAKPCILVAMKADLPDAGEIVPILREFYAQQFEILGVSAQTGAGIEPLRRAIFERLDVVRIHTKIPGKKPDLQSPPFVLKRGSTVLDLARVVHRDFVHTLKYARAWSGESSRRSIKFDGQQVERTHVLEDGEVLELHT